MKVLELNEEQVKVVKEFEDYRKILKEKYTYIMEGIKLVRRVDEESSKSADDLLEIVKKMVDILDLTISIKDNNILNIEGYTTSKNAKYDVVRALTHLLSELSFNTALVKSNSGEDSSIMEEVDTCRRYVNRMIDILL